MSRQSRSSPVLPTSPSTVTVTDLVAVGLVAALVVWATRRPIRSRPDVFTRGDTGRVVIVSLAYGLAVLVAISALHTYLTIPA